MSTGTSRPPSTARNQQTGAEAEPQPWRSAEDSKGWRVVARGAGRPRRVAVSIMVDLDHDQTDWLDREAERTGLDYDEIIKRMIDSRRAAATP